MPNKVSARSGIILINGHNYSTYAMAYDGSHSTGMVDVTGFGDSGQNFIPGLPIAKLGISMYWDNTPTTGVNAVLKSLPTGVVTLMPEGYALGNPSVSMPFVLGNYSPQGEPAGAIQLGTLAFEASGDNVGLENGWALAHGTITATTTGTGFDDPSGAAVTAICGASLHVWTPTSTDTYVVKVQHSNTLGSGYADLVTFTLNGLTQTAERINVASGTVNRYRRVIATRTGAAGDPFGFSVHFWHG